MTASRLAAAAHPLAPATSRRRLLGASSGGLAAPIGAPPPTRAAAAWRTLGRTCQTSDARD